jgi:hypothetical protein
VWNQWKPNYTSRYAKIIRDHHDKILLEVAGHDHVADARFTDQVYAPDKEKAGSNISFHNIILGPSMTQTSES